MACACSTASRGSSSAMRATPRCMGWAPSDMRPGTTLRAILEARVAAGSSPQAAQEYIETRIAEVTRNEPYCAVNELRDGRVIQVTHQPIDGGGWVAIHQDITDSRRDEEKVAFMARHDLLTGLANRTNFMEKTRGGRRAAAPAGRDVHRLHAGPRSLQERQRFARPSRRRRAAQGDRRSPEDVAAGDRRGGAARRRRIRDHSGRRARPARRRGRARETDHRSHQRALRDQRQHGEHRHQHRHRDGVGGRHRPGHADEAGRSRAVPDQIGRPQRLLLLRRENDRRRRCAPPTGVRPARRDLARRDRCALPADSPRQDAQAVRLRSAGALAAPGEGLHSADGIHSARRGNRPDRSARRMGVAQGLRGGDAVAVRDKGRGQHLGGAIRANPTCSRW